MLTQKTRRVLSLSSAGLLLTSFAGWQLISAGLAVNFYQPTNDPEGLIKKIKEATFKIFCEEPDEYARSGTGWHLSIADENYVITNAHVIDQCIDKNELYLVDHKREMHVTEILGYRHLDDYRGSFDIAVLRGRPDLPVLKLSSDEPRAGHWVLAVGWPVLGETNYLAVVQGHLTGVQTNGDLISDLDMHGGLSGAAIVNSRGEVIGTHYASTPEYSKRSLAQTISRLCDVAVICDKDKKPLTPLQFPENPIKTNIPDQED